MNFEKIIRETALKTIEIEKNTVANLTTGINTDFEKVVLAIYHSNGRVVLTGVGKSAIIAQKISATLNSTGTPALMMHAADAIHGDLGMIQPDDVVICLSKSGETPEVKVLVRLVKKMQNVLVGLTSNKNASLAQQADYLLYTPVSLEADPNNLAPTASTTAQMVMGDAVATALLALRGFTPADFAQYHPGGSLGKQLYLKVSDLYPQNESPKILLDALLPEIIVEMTSKRLGCAVVIDKNNKVQGIVTDGDLRRMLEKSHWNNKSGVTAAAIMTPHPKTIEKSCMAIKALEIMRQYSITQLIVVDNNDNYVGIVHLHDLIREGVV